MNEALHVHSELLMSKKKYCSSIVSTYNALVNTYDAFVKLLYYTYNNMVNMYIYTYIIILNSFIILEK